MLIIILNRDSYTGSLILLSLKKLINQLSKIMLELTALVEVSVTETGVRPIALVIFVDSISRLIEIREY
jgi:hypothetical protein